MSAIVVRVDGKFLRFIYLTSFLTTCSQAQSENTFPHARGPVILVLATCGQAQSTLPHLHFRTLSSLGSQIYFSAVAKQPTNTSQQLKPKSPRVYSVKNIPPPLCLRQDDRPPSRTDLMLRATQIEEKALRIQTHDPISIFFFLDDCLSFIATHCTSYERQEFHRLSTLPSSAYSHSCLTVPPRPTCRTPTRRVCSS